MNLVHPGKLLHNVKCNNCNHVELQNRFDRFSPAKSFLVSTISSFLISCFLISRSWFYQYPLFYSAGGKEANVITKRRIFSEIQLSTIPTKQSERLSWPPLAAGRGKWLPVWRSLQYSSKLITVPSKVYRSGNRRHSQCCEPPRVLGNLS